MASAWHEPLQLASHLAAQSASAGVTLQLASQSAVQLPLHEASHSALLLSAAQRPEQSALQSAWHDAVQLNSAGLTSQSASQLPWQLPVHSAEALTLHGPAHSTERSAAQAAWKLTGSHCAVHPPSTSTLHSASASTWMLPHAARLAAAASPEKKKGVASASAPMKSWEMRRMRFLEKSEHCLPRITAPRSPEFTTLMVPQPSPSAKRSAMPAAAGLQRYAPALRNPRPHESPPCKRPHARLVRGPDTPS